MEMFHKGDKVLIKEANQQYTTSFEVIAQMFKGGNVDLSTIAKFRFAKHIKSKELDWEKKQAIFVVVEVMDNPSQVTLNSQLCLIENNKHVYLIGNAGLYLSNLYLRQGEN